MSVVKKTADYQIIKRRDNRYAVKSAAGKPINGDDKVAILQAEGLIQVSAPKPEPAPEPAEETPETEAPAGEGSEEGAEEPGEARE